MILIYFFPFDLHDEMRGGLTSDRMSRIGGEVFDTVTIRSFLTVLKLCDTFCEIWTLIHNKTPTRLPCLSDNICNMAWHL